MKRIFSFFLTLLLALTLFAGAAFSASAPVRLRGDTWEDLDPYGYYYDLESVVLYLDAYGELPINYITKRDARDLGWEGGSVEYYLEDAAIGGDSFGNREGLLPKARGRSYTECDLETDGYRSRGAKRLIFSNDGLYFYTEDHYDSFWEVYLTREGKVAFR